MDENILIVESNDRDDFTERTKAVLMQGGWRVDSSSCGVVNSEQYDFCGYYIAVLVRGN